MCRAFYFLQHFVRSADDRFLRAARHGAGLRAWIAEPDAIAVAARALLAAAARVATSVAEPVLPADGFPFAACLCLVADEPYFPACSAVGQDERSFADEMCFPVCLFGPDGLYFPDD